MGKKRGLPKKYAKMGFKEGWKAYKKTEAWKKAHPNQKTNKRNPPKRNPRTGRNVANKNKKKRKPSYMRQFQTTMRMISQLAPHIGGNISNLTKTSIEPALRRGDWIEVIKRFFANELQLHTAYNYVTNEFDPKPLAVNLLAQIDVIGMTKRFVNRFTKIF